MYSGVPSKVWVLPCCDSQQKWTEHGWKMPENGSEMGETWIRHGSDTGNKMDETCINQQAVSMGERG
jgi:hypothetical protein